VGKTLIAKAISHEACTKGCSGRFNRTQKMLEYIYAGKAGNSQLKKMKIFLKPDLLVLDDWGLQTFPSHLLLPVIDHWKIGMNYFLNRWLVLLYLIDFFTMLIRLLLRGIRIENHYDYYSVLWYI
jgi:IstB-like ATP binding protein